MVTRTKKIFVGGLSAPSTLEDVKNYFEQFGRVSVLHSHWSNSNGARLSLVESFRVLLRQQSYAIKNQLGHPKTLTRSQKDPRHFVLAGSLWHKDS